MHARNVNLTVMQQNCPPSHVNQARCLPPKTTTMTTSTNDDKPQRDGTHRRKRHPHTHQPTYVHGSVECKKERTDSELIDNSLIDCD
mmetsp:Transcript_20958/g.59808  ORF Transcript_20958/g.59808 Transcript_20958/m.59808 type:complete len:87 (+) Transcript_20958:1235-1495(+)